MAKILKFSLAIGVLFMMSSLAVAQGGGYGQVYRGRFYRQAHLMGEQTFLTFSNGIGNQENLIMEGQFANRYGIVKGGRPWALMLDPKVVFRMSDDKSLPLRPPSFHVDMNYYRMLDNSPINSDEALWHFGIGHHSNGQSGSFFLPGDTIINLIDGNFAQNHFELGYVTYRNDNEDETNVRFRYYGIKAQVIPSFAAKWSGHEIIDRLGFYRPHVLFGIGGVRPGNRSGPLLKWRQQSQLKIDAGYILGDMLGAEIGDYDTRATLDVQYHYVLPFLDDLSVMLRFYRGQDYYNIRYDKTLSVMTFGVSSNIATIKSAVRYLD